MNLPATAPVTLSLGPAIDDTDFKSYESVAFDAAGIAVKLFQKAANGLVVMTAITPSNTNDDTHNYWVAAGGSGVHTLRITAAQNNVADGEMWVEAVATGVLPFGSIRYAVNPALSAQQKVDVNAEADTANTDTPVTLANVAHGGAAATLTLLSGVINNTGGVGLSITGSTTGMGVHGATIGLDVDASAGPGVDVDGTTFGMVIDASAGAGLDLGGTTAGLWASGSAGPGAEFVATGAAASGLILQGMGVGQGLESRGGATGDGILAVSGATSGSGFHAEALTLGDGILAVGAGAGCYDIEGDLQGLEVIEGAGWTTETLKALMAAINGLVGSRTTQEL